MIKSFADRDTEDLYNEIRVSRFEAFERKARQKLEMIDATISLDGLRVPPGNRLEALKGDRAGQFSIRINDQWRICFHWSDGNAHDVEICDYH
jgi:toxin HigB-1